MITEANSFAVDKTIAQYIVKIKIFNPIYDFDKKVLKYDQTSDNTT
ncbi:MAG: hypothetical protein ACPKPY_10285 [Nitrososphaeraceae archaeon]